MRPAPSIREFLRQPVGRYVAGPSYSVWAAAPDLIGNAYFGRPTEPDLADHRRMFDFPSHADLIWPFDVLLDASGLEAAGFECYELLCWYLRHKVPEFVPMVRHLALVQPPSYAGALIIGIFHQLVSPRFRARLFDNHREALVWMGRPDQEDVGAQLSDMMAEIIDAPALLGRLRALLGDYPGLRLGAAARRLGVSERTLQRVLQPLGTSFRAEQDRARLVHAEALLRTTDTKVAVIARRVGFASASHFSTVFRRAHGISAREYRRER